MQTRKYRKYFNSLMAVSLVVTPVAVSAEESNQFSHVVFANDGKHYAVPYDAYNAAVGLGWIDPLKITHVTINGKTFTREILNAVISLEDSMEAARAYLEKNTTHVSTITTILTTIDSNGVVIPQEPVPDYTPGPPPDTTPPNFISASIESIGNNLVIWAEFNETIQNAALTNPLNFEVNGKSLTSNITVESSGGQVTKITIPAAEIQAIFGEDPTRKTLEEIIKKVVQDKLKVKVTNVQDVAGNVLAGTTQELELSSYVPLYTYPTIQGVINTPLSAAPPTYIGKAAATGFALKAGQQLPAGLTLDPLTGQISGTPTAVTQNGTPQAFTIEVSYVDRNGTPFKTETQVSIEIPQVRITAMEPINGATNGVAKLGQPLTVGAVTPATATIAYQWQIANTQNGPYTDISGATTNTYTPIENDKGKFIRVVATGTGNYTGQVESTPISVQ